MSDEPFYHVRRKAPCRRPRNFAATQVAWDSQPTLNVFLKDFKCSTFVSAYCVSFYLRLAGPGTVFIQATNRGRYSRAIAADRAAQRAGVGGAGDMMKAAVVTIGLVVILLAFFDVN